MLRTPFPDKNLEPTLIRKFSAYLIHKGWTQVDHPNTRIILFYGLLDDEGEPLQLILPANTTFLDTRLRIAEALDLLSIVQQESHAAIFDQIMATELEKRPEAVRFLKWLAPIFHKDFGNAAFASSGEHDSIATRKLIADGLLDKEFPNISFKLFSSNDGYEIVIQTSNAAYNGRIVAFGAGKDSISLLGVISGGHEVYDDFVSNLFFKGNYSRPTLTPLALLDETTLSYFFQEGQVSQPALSNSVNSAATESGKKAWERIAQSEHTAQPLRETIEAILKKQQQF
jgi:hypothetical protein